MSASSAASRVPLAGPKRKTTKGGTRLSRCEAPRVGPLIALHSRSPTGNGVLSVALSSRSAGRAV